MKHSTHIIAMIMAFVMTLGALVLIPVTASAEEGTATVLPVNPHEEKYGAFSTRWGIEVPEGMTPWDGTVAAGYADTSAGTADDPIEIRDEAEFMYFRNNATVSDTRHYVLTRDLYMNKADHGNSAALLTEATTDGFGGTLDGRGFSICNLSAYQVDNINNGCDFTPVLFESVAAGACIKNLNLVGAHLHSASTGVTSVASIAHTLAGTLDNIHIIHSSVISSFSSSNGKAAGFILTASDGAVIRNCSFGGKTGIAQGVSGGFASSATGTVLFENCTNYATVEGGQNNASPIGGLVGNIASASDLTFIGCANHGDVRTTNKQGTVGGIIGRSENAASLRVEDCTNYGSVSGSGVSNGCGQGGIVGCLSINTPTLEVELINCTNYGTVGMSSYVSNVGGIVGYFVSACKKRLTITMTGLVNYGDIIGVTGVGGIFGYYFLRQIQSNHTVENSANHGTVTATDSNAGGLAGKMHVYATSGATSGILSVSGFYNDGSVTAPTAVGGVYGWACEVTQTKKLPLNMCHSYIAGTVSATNADGVAGVICATAVSGSSTGNLVLGTTANNGYSATVTVNNATVASPLLYPGYDTSSKTYVSVTTPTPGVVEPKAADTAAETLNAYAVASGSTPWIQGAEAPMPITAITPSGATMSLAGTMQLNIKLEASKIASIVSAAEEAGKTVSVYVKDASDVGVAAPLSGNYYSAAFDVLASEMDREMSLRMVISIGDKQYESETATAYSPLTYALNTYATYKDSDETLAALLVNMMHYAATAEINAKGTAHIASVLAEQSISAPVWEEGFSAHLTEHVTQADKDAINAIALTGATLTGGIDIIFDVTDASYTTLTVNGVTYEKDSEGKIVFDGINAGNIRTTYTVTFSGGEGVTPVTARFSVGHFLDGRRAGSEQALAEATILYMMSARTYVLSK